MSTAEELRQMGEFSHQRGGNEPKKQSRDGTSDRHFPDSVHGNIGKVPDGLAAKAVQKAQVGTRHPGSNLSPQNHIIPYIGEMQMRSSRPYHNGRACTTTLSKMPPAVYIGARSRNY